MATSTPNNGSTRDDLLTDYERSVICSRQPEQQREQRRSRRQEALLEQVGQRHQHCTFNNYRISHPTQARAFDIVRDQWYWKSNSLLLCGGAGVGKTHLAVASYRSLQENGGEWDLDPLFVNETDFLQSWRAAAASKTKFDAIGRLRTGNVLFLDDVGTGCYTDGSLELLYQVVDYRYRNDLRTMFTTNYSLAALEQRLGEKLVSRIADRSSSVVVLMEGPNYRMTGAT